MSNAQVLALKFIAFIVSFIVALSPVGVELTCIAATTCFWFLVSIILHVSEE